MPKKIQKKKKGKTAPQAQEVRPKDFLDLIAPAAVKFNTDHYICGSMYHCTLALRSYPATTEELALLRHLGEKSGVTLSIYTRQVTAAEENGILHSHITASDDSRDLIAEKRSVTGGTVGHPGSCQFFLPRHAQLPVDSSGGKYKGPCLIGVALTHHALDGAPASILDFQDLVLHEPGSQTVRVFPKLKPQIVSADSGKSGIVIHLIRGQDLASADHGLLNHKRIQLCPLGINSGCKTCRSGADNN